MSKFFRRKPKSLMGSPAANDKVRDKLAEFGDDGATVRHVLHYAYPERGNDLASRPGMIEELKARGFNVSDAAAKDGLVIEHHRAVQPDDFDGLTAELSAWFAARGWEYDGWECAVVQAGAAPLN